jgi:fructose-1,6-bisphosphatase I
MAMIMEQAGGKATDGFMDILNIEATDIHQRCPLFIGSSSMVTEAMDYLKQYSNVEAQPQFQNSAKA